MRHAAGAEQSKAELINDVGLYMEAIDNKKNERIQINPIKHDVGSVFTTHYLVGIAMHTYVARPTPTLVVGQR